MYAMNMPGFTAETSFYKTSGPYQSVAQSYSSGEQGVISQMLATGTGGGGGGGLNEEQTCITRCQWICGRFGCYPYNCYTLCF
jgi:hypothetical protein